MKAEPNWLISLKSIENLELLIVIELSKQCSRLTPMVKFLTTGEEFCTKRFDFSQISTKNALHRTVTPAHNDRPATREGCFAR